MGKKIPRIFFLKKTGHVTKNSEVCKFFWGIQKIFGDQQNVFGADLRKNGEPKVNLGSGENIFGHLIFFGGLKKIFSGVENVSAHKIIFPLTIIYNLGILPHLAKHRNHDGWSTSSRL